MGCSVSSPQPITSFIKGQVQPKSSKTQTRSQAIKPTHLVQKATKPAHMVQKATSNTPEEDLYCSFDERDFMSLDESLEESNYSMYEQKSFYDEDEEEDFGAIRKATLFSLMDEEEIGEASNDEFHFSDGSQKLPEQDENGYNSGYLTDRSLQLQIKEPIQIRPQENTKVMLNLPAKISKRNKSKIDSKRSNLNNNSFKIDGNYKMSENKYDELTPDTRSGATPIHNMLKQLDDVRDKNRSRRKSSF